MCSLARIIVKLLDWNTNYVIDSEDSHENGPRQRGSINNDGITGNKDEQSFQRFRFPGARSNRRRSRMLITMFLIPLPILNR